VPDVHRGDRPGPGGGPVRVFISYAHDDPGHEDRVRDFWVFLRAHGVDARVDLAAAQQRVDWAQWMTWQVRDADVVLVVASPQYRRRAEGDAGPGEGRGCSGRPG
jgi:SEFIR domain